MNTPLVVRNRDFAFVWVAQILTQSSIRMFQVGVTWWLVAEAISGDQGLAAGLFMATIALPAIAMAPLVARTIARFSHRQVLRCAAAAAAGIAALLAAWAIVGTLPVLAVYAGAFGLACAQALFDPCLTTSVTELVDDHDIETATSAELSTQSLAGLVGAFLGPALVTQSGASTLILACTAAYLLAFILISQSVFRPKASAHTSTGSPNRQMRAVLRELPFVRAVLLCFAAANLFTTAIFVIIPLYTRSTLHADGYTVALLEAALGIGALVGALTGRLVPGRDTVAGGVCLLAMAAALATPGLIANLAIMIVSLAVAGCCVGIIGVRFVALFQRVVPTDDKPVFFTMMQAMLAATYPLACVLFGIAGDFVSPQILCLVQGVGVVPAAVVLATLRQPQPIAQPSPQLSGIGAR